MSSEPTDTISINCGAGDALDADNHDDNHDATPAAIPSGDDLVSIRMASGTVVKAPASYWLECFRTHTLNQQAAGRETAKQVVSLLREESERFDRFAIYQGDSSRKAADYRLRSKTTRQLIAQICREFNL